MDNFYLYIEAIDQEITPTKGIPQGSGIAPMLFSMAMVMIMETAL